jgi:hypothetical protein
MQRLEVSHDGGSILLVVFFGERWHLILYSALDHERHMRTTNLELQKARRVLASIRVLAMAVSRQSPVRDIASLTTSLHTAKATRRPNAGQTNR